MVYVKVAYVPYHITGIELCGIVSVSGVFLKRIYLFCKELYKLYHYNNLLVLMRK